MWSYYGRKKKIIKKYPIPIHHLIIEPFAGTASYAMEYFDHDVLLVDKYEKICKIWWYLQQAKPDDILKLPDVENAEFIGDKYMWMCDEEKWLMGFCINNASPMPKHTAGRMNFNSWNRDKIRIAKELYKIKHWKIELCSFDKIQNQEAVWFIDPPYQFGGHAYIENEINYEQLSGWVKERMGQIIVCENTKADWLPFLPMKKIQGAAQSFTTEAIWSNHKTNYDDIQQKLY